MKTHEEMARNREMEMAANIVLFLFGFFLLLLKWSKYLKSGTFRPVSRKWRSNKKGI